MKTWLIRIAALIVFGVSFALPAIRPADAGASAQPIAGWTCALFASILAPKALASSIGQGIQRDAILVPVSGLVNYLFLAVLVLSSWRRLVRTRLIVGALMILCFIATWVFFATSKVTPLVGHYLWIAGAILFLVPDVVMLVCERKGAAAASAGGVEAVR